MLSGLLDNMNSKWAAKLYFIQRNLIWKRVVIIVRTDILIIFSYFEPDNIIVLFIFSPFLLRHGTGNLQIHHANSQFLGPIIFQYDFLVM